MGERREDHAVLEEKGEDHTVLMECGEITTLLWKSADPMAATQLM